MTAPEATRGPLPAGTVTFLRSDIEGSMQLVRQLGSAFDTLNAAHQRIVREAVALHGGHEVRTEGDAFFVVFADAGRALRAAVAIQRAIATHVWPDDAPIRLRVGLHAGSAHLAGDDYGGFEVNRAARIASSGSGGQIVLSDPVRALIAGDLPPGTAIRDLGRHRLKDVAEPEHLFQLDVDGLPTVFPAPRGVEAGAGNIAPRMTSFVGRDAELARLTELLAGRRLITLTGPGGAGKTSLAIELARRVEASFADGAWLVDLAPVREPSLVKGTIARTLGLSDGVAGPAADRVEGYLADRTLLLLVDNFEHLLEASDTVTSILRAAPRVKVLVASRAPLRIAGEQEVAVGPLDAGVEEGPGGPGAIDLFLDRARSVRPELAVTPADLRAIREICSLLDGLPLGIELAAARVAHLPVSAIRDRLAARLPLPGSGPRDLPARQRTLEDAIGWSLDLLDAPAQRLFARAGVFAGSFDLAQAESVCGPAEELGIDVLDGLTRLADQSLLRPAPGEGDTGIRFRTLETIRAAALARLRASGEEADRRTRHASAYGELAARAAPHMPGAGQVLWLDRLTADSPNLRQAILWTVERGAAPQALLLVANLWRFWLMSGRLHEGRELIDLVFAMPGAAEPSPERVRALDAAAGVAYWKADSERAKVLYEEQLRLARDLGLRWEEANATFNLAHTHFAVGNAPAAAEAMQAAQELAREVADEQMILRCEWAYGAATQHQGRPHEALARFQELTRQFAETGDVWYQGLATGSVAWSAFAIGDLKTALEATVESLRIAHGLRDMADVTISLQISAVLAVASDRAREAAVMLGAFTALSELHGVRPPAGLEALIGMTGAPEPAARQALGAGAFDAAFAEGTRMSPDEAVAYVIDLARALGTGG